MFPRNCSTYAPSPLLPVVLAIQNPGFVQAVNGTPGWQVYIDNGTFSGFVPPLDQSDVFQNYTGSSTNGTYYMWSVLGSHFASEHTWQLNWMWTLSNCSLTDHYSSTVVFTTKKGAPEADLQGFSDACTNPLLPPLVTQNVTATLLDSERRPTCLRTSSVLSPNPCGAHLDAADASGITSAINAWNCAAEHPLAPCSTASTTTTQPSATPSQSNTPHDNGATAAVPSRTSGLVLLLAASWLGCSLFQ